MRLANTNPPLLRLSGTENLRTFYTTGSREMGKPCEPLFVGTNRARSKSHEYLRIGHLSDLQTEQGLDKTYLLSNNGEMSDACGFKHDIKQWKQRNDMKSFKIVTKGKL